MSIESISASERLAAQFVEARKLYKRLFKMNSEIAKDLFTRRLNGLQAGINFGVPYGSLDDPECKQAVIQYIQGIQSGMFSEPDSRYIDVILQCQDDTIEEMQKRINSLTPALSELIVPWIARGVLVAFVALLGDYAISGGKYTHKLTGGAAPQCSQPLIDAMRTRTSCGVIFSR